MSIIWGAFLWHSYWRSDILTKTRGEQNPVSFTGLLWSQFCSTSIFFYTVERVRESVSEGERQTRNEWTKKREWETKREKWVENLYIFFHESGQLTVHFCPFCGTKTLSKRIIKERSKAWETLYLLTWSTDTSSWVGLIVCSWRHLAKEGKAIK